MPVKRRFWSVEEKRSICLQASVPGVSVARVAQRYSMNANLIFKWLRDARFAPEVEAHREAVFLPVEVSPHGMTEEPSVPDTIFPAASPAGGPAVGLLRIELSSGHRLVAEGRYDPEVLGRLLKAWLS